MGRSRGKTVLIVFGVCILLAAIIAIQIILSKKHKDNDNDNKNKCKKEGDACVPETRAKNSAYYGYTCNNKKKCILTTCVDDTYKLSDGKCISEN